MQNVLVDVWTYVQGMGQSIKTSMTEKKTVLTQERTALGKHLYLPAAP